VKASPLTEVFPGIVQCSVCGRVAADDHLPECDAAGCISRGIGWHYVERVLTCSVCLKIISHEEGDILRGTDQLKRV
jgi:hypothetical protein